MSRGHEIDIFTDFDDESTHPDLTALDSTSGIRVQHEQDLPHIGRTIFGLYSPRYVYEDEFSSFVRVPYLPLQLVARDDAAERAKKGNCGVAEMVEYLGNEELVQYLGFSARRILIGTQLDLGDPEPEREAIVKTEVSASTLLNIFGLKEGGFSILPGESVDDRLFREDVENRRKIFRAARSPQSTEIKEETPQPDEPRIITPKAQEVTRGALTTIEEEEKARNQAQEVGFY